MMMRTPKFWYKRPGLYSFLLTPVAWLYQLVHRFKQSLKKQPYKSDLPVVCIGNAVAGGSGKTPAAIAILKMIREQGIAKNPMFLSRGYGGTIKRATIVDLNRHTYADTGDEPLLLARHATTIIAPDRAVGARLAEANGADLIVMDDGLQNNKLHKDLSLLVVDRRIDFGNNKTIPAGPLREPLKVILPKIHAIICIGFPFHSEKPVFEAMIKPIKIPTPRRSYLAFAGIGWPEKFKHSLEDLDVSLRGWHAYADHYMYTEDDIKALKQEAREKDITLITTEKDFLRLPKGMTYDIKTFPIEMDFLERDDLADFIRKKIAESV